MTAQVIGPGELGDELIDDALLLCREVVGVFGVDSGEVGSAQLPGGAIDIDGACTRIDLVQEQPVVHIELGVAHDDLPLELEQQDVDCFDKRSDVVVRVIGLVREGHKGAQRDAVIVFENLVVAVAQVVAQDADDACLLTRSGPHP